MSDQNKTKTGANGVPFTALFGKWLRFALVIACAALMIGAIWNNPMVLVPAFLGGLIAWFLEGVEK